MSEANKALVLRYQNAYNANDLVELDELLDPEWTTNSWLGGARTVADAKTNHRAMLDAVPDMQYTTLELIAEGDRVVQRWAVAGTHSRELMGVAPTGRRLMARGVSIFRIAGGRIIEHLAWFDELGLLEQLGVAVPSEWAFLRHSG